MLEVTSGPLHEPEGRSFVSAAPDAKFVLIPDAALLFTADFKQSGPDLVLTGADGRHTVVIDYFKAAEALSLVAPNGAKLTPDVIELLSGSHTHAQYAQAGAAQPAPVQIGTVKTLIGNVTVMRNGVEVALKVGDAVLKSDVVQTGSGSAVGITFPDGTALHITANARMALSEYNFDSSNTTGNGAFFHLIDGTFSFVAGQVAKTGGLKIETPVATVGIRGTTGWVKQGATISAQFGNTTYSFAVTTDQNSDHVGLYDVTDQYGNIFTVSEKGVLTTLTGQGVGQPPSVTTEAMTAEQIAFEQQIVQAVFNALNLQGTTPNFDSGHDGTLQQQPFIQHNEIPGNTTTTFALTLPTVNGPVTGTVTVTYQQRPVLPVESETTNHSPTLDPGTLPGVRANDFNPPGQTVGTIFAGKFHDVDSGAKLVGIAVASNTANPYTQGVWQYSNNGSVWINIGSVSPSEALVLSADTLIRFLPARNFYGDPPPLVVYGLDDTYTGSFTGLVQVAIDATAGGGDSPISATPVELATSVNADVWIQTTGGDWATAGNWSDGVPGLHDVVVVDLPAHQTVTFDGGGTTTTATIAKLVNVGGGTLDVTDSAVLRVHGPVANDGKLVAGHEGELSFRHAQVDNLDGGAIEAKGCNATVEFSNSFVKNAGLIAAAFQGLVTFDHVFLKNTADGVIKAAGCGSEIDFCNVFMTNAGVVEARHDGFISFDHAFLYNTTGGVIQADGCGSEIDFSHVFMKNAWQVAARHEGFISFDHVNLDNAATGVVEAVGCGSEIDFSHSNIANGGAIEAQWGGLVSVDQTTIDNTNDGANDGVIRAVGHDAVVELYDTTVTGGTLTTSHGGLIVAESGSGGGTVFDGSQTDSNNVTLGVTLDGHVLVDDDSSLMLLGDIHNHRTIEVQADSSGSHLVIGGEVTLDGCGTIKLDGCGNSIVGSGDSSCNVLTNVDNTILGAGSIGDGCSNDLKLVNQSDGVINANVCSDTLVIDTGWHHVVNAGLLEASHGGTLEIDSNVDNACGLIQANYNSSVIVDADICGGNALIKGGTVEYDGSSDVFTTFAANTDGTLVFGTCSDFTGHVAGFDGGDMLDFKGIDYSGCSQVFYCGADGTLTVSDDTNSSTIHLDGDYCNADFVLFDDGCGGLGVGFAPHANDDNVIASTSAIDCNSLYLPSHVLLDNDTATYPGDTLEIDQTTSGCSTCVSGPDSDGNVRVHYFGQPDDTTFSYEAQDSLNFQTNDASVNVILQCGALTGTSSNEILLPGSESACLTGGGGNDTFLFQNDVSTGYYTITDFATHSHGAGADVIDLDNFSDIENFHDVLQAAHESSGNTVIDLGGGSSITLQNVHISDLSSADFAVHHASSII